MRLYTQPSPQDAASIRQAIELIADVRGRVTLQDFQDFVRINARSFGGDGFIESIGHALVGAAAGALKDRQGSTSS